MRKLFPLPPPRTTQELLHESELAADPRKPLPPPPPLGPADMSVAGATPLLPAARRGA